MKRFFFSFFALQLAACATGPAEPFAGGLPDYQAFLQADADSSGKLNAEEAKAFPALAENFQRYDADGDALIAWNELKRVGRLDGDRRRSHSPEPR